MAAPPPPQTLVAPTGGGTAETGDAALCAGVLGKKTGGRKTVTLPCRARRPGRGGLHRVPGDIDVDGVPWCGFGRINYGWRTTAGGFSKNIFVGPTSGHRLTVIFWWFHCVTPL